MEEIRLRIADLQLPICNRKSQIDNRKSPSLLDYVNSSTPPSYAAESNCRVNGFEDKCPWFAGEINHHHHHQEEEDCHHMYRILQHDLHFAQPVAARRLASLAYCPCNRPTSRTPTPATAL
jgi:hypothetical protein